MFILFKKKKIISPYKPIILAHSPMKIAGNIDSCRINYWSQYDCFFCRLTGIIQDREQLNSMMLHFT